MLLTTTFVALLSPVTVLLSAAQVVHLGYASYEGSLDVTTGIAHFLGVRYAAAPTGPLRWRLPKTPDPVAGILEAKVRPPQCPATIWGSGSTNPSYEALTDIVGTPEDCLFLNVYTPELPTVDTKAKPVVVWIHGGGYGMGSAAQYNGEDLVSGANNGVVSVVIQYRLGVYGFLAGDEVEAGGVLNAGLRDQEFALQWVQEHIGKFGGDPTQVTIWGESAGAGSVLQHVIANDGKTSPPLFRAALTSSTYLPSQYLYNHDIPQTLYNEVVSHTNCTSAQDTLACLREVDFIALDVANHVITARALFRTFVFVPVVDGTFITQRPSQALGEGKINGEVLLSVTNTFEGNIFVDQDTASTVKVPEFVHELFPTLGEEEIARATALYENLGSPIDQVNSITSDTLFICPTYPLLRAFKDKSFKGEFGLLPALHGDDLHHFFPTSSLFGPKALDVAPEVDIDLDATGYQTFLDLAMNSTSTHNKNVKDFDKAFSRSFLDFVISLDPNIKLESTISPPWKPWADGQVEMLFNKTGSGEPVVELVPTSSSLLERCSFWESVGHISGQ